MTALSVIQSAIEADRREWRDPDPLSIANDLVCSGHALDNVIGEASLEARIERSLLDVASDYDGRYCAEVAAARVAFALGLASWDEASDHAGLDLPRGVAA